MDVSNKGALVWIPMKVVTKSRMVLLAKRTQSTDIRDTLSTACWADKVTRLKVGKSPRAWVRHVSWPEFLKRIVFIWQRGEEYPQFCQFPASKILTTDTL